MRFLLATLGALTLGTSSAWAWGDSGHSIAAEVAQRHLAASTLQAIAELMGDDVSLASLSSWADDERARDRTTTRWHFVDIPLEETHYDASRDCRSIPGEGDCIVAAMEREKAVVACATAPSEDRRRALKFLVHFVGDLHQPFHALLEERGGNGVSVTIVTREGVNGRDPFNSNLHSAFDSALIDKTAWSWGGYVDRLVGSDLAGPGSANAAGTVVEWAEESHALASRLFEDVPANGVLDDTYRRSVLPLLDEQLAKGGLRLARLLDEAFASANCP